MNHLAYADDVVLLAPSARALQALLNVCNTYAMKNNVIYNTEKTKCMVFWNDNKHAMYARFTLQGDILKINPEFKYLGV